MTTQPLVLREGMEVAVEYGHPLPDHRGGRTAQPNPYRSLIAELKAKGLPTPDGQTTVLWFPGVLEETPEIREVKNALKRLGPEFGVHVYKIWRKSTRKVGRKTIRGSQITIYLRERPAP